MAKCTCRQNNFDNDESHDSNDDDEQYERKIKKKLKKVNLDTYKRGVYCKNYYKMNVISQKNANCQLNFVKFVKQMIITNIIVQVKQT
jgi:hypothetical protein